MPMNTVSSKSILRWLPLVGSALFLLLVILPFIGRYGLWFDEVFSATMARDLNLIVDMVRTQENNMLLHYLLLWLWMPLGDGSEAFLRSLSLLLILLSLLPLHATARRLANDTVANSCCFVYASHFLVLDLAQSCRGYALAAFMATLVFWSWARAWETQKISHWLQTGLLAGFAVWSHYFAALIPPVLVFAMLWRDGWKQPWKQLIIAFTAFVLMALPIVLTRPPDGVAQIGWADVPDTRHIRGILWMLGGVDGPSEKSVLSAMLGLIGFVLLLRNRQWRTNSTWRSVSVGLAVGLVIMVAALLAESFLWQPLFVQRFFMPLIPLYCFVLGAGLALLWPWLRIILIAFMLLTSVWQNWKAFAGPLPVSYWWRPMLQHLARDMQPDDVILMYPSFERMPVDYYLDKIDVEHALPRPTEYASGYYRPGSGAEPEPDWQRLQNISTNTSGRVWLITDEKTIPSWSRLNRVHAPAIREFLLKDRQRNFVTRHATMTVEGYDKPITDVSGALDDSHR